MGNATDPSLQSFTPFVSFLAYSFVLVGQTWHNNSSGGGGIVVVVLDNLVPAVVMLSLLILYSFCTYYYYLHFDIVVVTITDMRQFGNLFSSDQPIR